MSKNLFADSDDNSDEGFQIKTNENYAKSFNSLRKKELLQKFKDKGLDVSETDSDDSDSSEEDEILDPSFDQDFLKTLASLKSKDPSIYDQNTKFFKSDESQESIEDEEKESRITGKKSKPVTLKDYERKIILEKGGKFEDEDSEEEGTVQRSFSPTIVEEERRLKAEFKKVMNDSEDSEDEEFGGIFKKREKSKIEKDKEEEDYLKWLAGKKETIGEDVKEKLEPLKEYWSNDKLPSSEKFLRDYVLNKGYTEASNYDEIPTYDEIVGDQAPLSEDEHELEKQAEFEQKYNFRFEEPDQEFIKRYPRTIETSLRLNDEKRKKKRQELKDRKLQEKQQKLKEIEMVKEMKRKEIQEKIEKLKMVTGNDELGFKDDDLEEDFDPDAHDRRMQELFNEDFYQVDEGEEKPECPSDIEELKVEDWDNYDPQREENVCYDDPEPHCEDEDFNMDCEYDPTKAKEDLQKELIENTRKRRGRKGRRDRFMEVIKAEKPVFDPEDEKTYGEYIDEYYKLDCEDVIDDVPCRFKYVETTPNDFGLSIEEILLAKNKELNQWASLKKAIQLRPDYVEKKEQRLYKMKAKNEDLKRKIFKSLYGEDSDNENEGSEMDQTKVQETKETANATVDSKKAKKKKKRKAKNPPENSLALNENATEVVAKDLNEEANHEKGAKKSKTDENAVSDMPSNSDTTRNDLGKKKRKKNKSKNKNQVEHAKTNESNKQSFPEVTNHIKKTNNDMNKQTVPTVKNERKKLVNDKPPTTKFNPFASVPSANSNYSKETGPLPPLRKNLPKVKKLDSKSNTKFKSKFNTKTPFKGNPKNNFSGDSKSISDERLKAYGINPKKFHKKQKYGNEKNK